MVSYTHIAPLLKASVKGNPNPTIYDPYYCDGSVIGRLGSVGLTDVVNEKKDCYDVWSKGEEKEYQCFVTNPPYSDDHTERLMKYLCEGGGRGKPWFLLMPQYVHKHKYYQQVTRGIRPFYVVPKKRYVYEPPEGFRGKKKSDTHKKSSPFVSMWYCWGGNEDANRRIMDAWRNGKASGGGRKDTEMAKSKSGLRDLRRKK